MTSAQIFKGSQIFKSDNAERRSKAQVILPDTEHDIVTFLVYCQATREEGRIEGAVPPSTDKRTMAKHFRPAEFKWALKGLSAHGMIPPDALDRDDLYLTAVGVEYACLTGIARWGDEHLIGESDGPYFLFEELQGDPPDDPVANAAMQARIQSVMKSQLLEMEREFFEWGKTVWAPEDLLTE